MEKFTPPGPLTFEGNIADKWKKWRQEFEFFLVATESDAKSHKIKSSILLTCVGQRGRDIYNTFTSVDNKLKLLPILAKFEEYCLPRKNITYLRYTRKFFSYHQREGQSFDHFVTEFKKLSSECELGTLLDSLIRDMIIVGITDNRLRERLLCEADLTLERCIQLGHAAEQTKLEVEELKREIKSIDQVKSHKQDVKHKTKSRPSRNKNVFFKNCKFCGGSHKCGECPAFGQKCKSCHGMNHFAKCCPKAKKVQQIECESSTESLVSSDDDFYVGLITANQAENNESDYDDLHSLIDSDNESDDENDDFDDQPDVDFVDSTSDVSNSVQEDNNTSSDESESHSDGTHTDIKPLNDLCDITDLNNADYESEDINTEIFSVDSDPSQKHDWTIYLNTNGTDVEFKIDSGAQVNILQKNEFNRLHYKPTLKSTRVKLTAYNGSSIPVLSKCIAKAVHKNKPVYVLFIVADIKSPPVLGLDTSEKLSLIKRIMAIDTELPESLAEFEDCFGEHGCLPEVHHINLKLDVTPVVHPPRRIAYALCDKLRDQLQCMEKLDIIEKVSEPTDWVNSLVIVSKVNGKLRICIDLRDLNRAIKHQHYQLPSAENLFARMSGTKYFAKLDMSNAYWHIRVDEESSKLLTFNTLFGRFKF